MRAAGRPADRHRYRPRHTLAGDASRARRTGGSGLGLAIVQSIVQAHGGTVTVASAPERGTTVTIALQGTPSGANPPVAR